MAASNYTVPPLPAPTTPMILPNGTVNPVWYRYFKAADAALRALLTKVNP